MLAGLFGLTISALFTGAALYINIAENPARLSLDDRSMLAEWKPAYEAGYKIAGHAGRHRFPLRHPGLVASSPTSLAVRRSHSPGQLAMDPAGDQTREHGSHEDAAERSRGAHAIIDEKMERAARRAHLAGSLRDGRVPHRPRPALVRPCRFGAVL